MRWELRKIWGNRVLMVLALLLFLANGWLFYDHATAGNFAQTQVLYSRTQELEEMAQADAEIDREFEADWDLEPPPPVPQLVWVSRLARQNHTTYGRFVSTHTEEEIRELVEQLKGETV